MIYPNRYQYHLAASVLDVAADVTAWTQIPSVPSEDIFSAGLGGHDNSGDVFSDVQGTAIEPLGAVDVVADNLSGLGGIFG